MRRYTQLVLLVLMVGCGAQHGRFKTTGEQFQALSSPPGCIDIVSGQALAGPDTSDQNLLYLAIVLPGVHGQGSANTSDYGTHITTLQFQWQTDAGSVSIPVQWDRRRDTVSVSNQTFARSRGNVLVVRREADGALTAKQVESLAHGNASTVLRHLREQLPQDKLIASLRLQEP